MRNFTTLLNIFVLGILLTACANHGLEHKQAAAPDDQTYAKLEKHHDRQIDRLSVK